MQFADCKHLWGHKEEKAMINTFMHSNVNYYGPAFFVFGSKLQEKTSFTTAGNFAKLFDTPGNSKVKNQYIPMEIPHGFFLNILALEIALLF